MDGTFLFFESVTHVMVVLHFAPYSILYSKNFLSIRRFSLRVVSIRAPAYPARKTVNLLFGSRSILDCQICTPHKLLVVIGVDVPLGVP